MKTAEGTLRVKILELNKEHIEVVLTATNKKSWPMLEHLKNILLSTFPSAFQSHFISEGIKEIKITAVNEEEHRRRHQAYLDNERYKPTL